MTDKTPARLAAEELVKVSPPSGPFLLHWMETEIPGLESSHTATQAELDTTLGYVTAIIHRAIFTHVASVVPPDEATEKRLAYFEGMAQSASNPDNIYGNLDIGTVGSYLEELLDIVTHYRTLAARLITDSDAYQAGREVGRREGEVEERERTLESVAKLAECSEQGTFKMFAEGVRAMKQKKE